MYIQPSSFYRTGAFIYTRVKRPDIHLCLHKGEYPVLGPAKNMRKKRGRGPANSEYFAELREHGVRSNLDGILFLKAPDSGCTSA